MVCLQNNLPQPSPSWHSSIAITSSEGCTCFITDLSPTFEQSLAVEASRFADPILARTLFLFVEGKLLGETSLSDGNDWAFESPDPSQSTCSSFLSLAAKPCNVVFTSSTAAVFTTN